MTCPDCDGDRIRFAVPSALRQYAPEESATARLCSNCLRLTADAESDSAADAPPSVDWDPLPTGEAGVATALLLGLLDSLALRREDVTALVEHAEAAGGDPFSTLDRLVALADAGDIDPLLDIDRRATQLRSLVD